MMFKSLLALTLAVSATAVTINGPSGDLYWVQFAQNNISWGSVSSSDTNPVDVTITNPNDTFLNGPFSIARNLDITNQTTFLTTNVTLKVATGYVLNFVNTSNQSQVFASSQPFEVKLPGTVHAGSSSSSSSGSNGTSTSGNSTGSVSVTGTSTNTASSNKPTSGTSGALRVSLRDGNAIVLGYLGLSVVMAVSGTVLTI